MASRPSSDSLVETPAGPARVVVDAAARPARATLVLGHGAGGGVDARDLAVLATRLPPEGITVVRVEQPWRVRGRRVATPPATLDLAWLAVLQQLPGIVGTARPLVVGGRSAGARVACRTAEAAGADAVLALAFPLHPPGRPERTRLAELAGVTVPVLAVQGERDTFGGPELLPRTAGLAVVALPEADHSFAVRRRAAVSDAEVADRLSSAVLGWLAKLGAQPAQ